MKPLILLSACIVITTMTGCAKTEPKATKTEHSPAEHKQDETQARYTCPMHPEVVSDKPGECPKCGMDLEIVTRPK